MVDKTKKAPVPERPQPDTKKADPTYIRGTIDPPTKKKG